MGVVDVAREMHAKGEPWWSHPLIIVLEAHRTGLALEWVERCCGLLLPLVPTDAREALLADIEDLRSYCEGEATREEILKRAHAIWYKPPARDAARTAISNLYGALAGVKEGPVSVFSLAAPINNLLSGSEHPGELFELVLSEFRCFCEQQGVSGARPTQLDAHPIARGWKW